MFKFIIGIRRRISLRTQIWRPEATWEQKKSCRALHESHAARHNQRRSALLRGLEELPSLGERFTLFLEGNEQDENMWYH